MNNRYELPINYTKLDIQKLFLGIGASQEWIEKVSHTRMNYLLSLIWDCRNNITWNEIHEALRKI